MSARPVQDAKARSSEMLDTCLTEGPLLVNRRGEEAAMLAPIAEWRQLVQSRGLTLEDAVIATAVLVHGLTVATRNERDFALLRAPTFNPFQ